MSTHSYISSEPQFTFRISGIYTAIDVVFENNFVFAGERHPFWEIVYVKSGSVQAVEDENTYTLYEGDMICHAPNEFHRIRSAGGTAPHMHILSFASQGELPEDMKKGIFHLDTEIKAEYERLFSLLHRFNKEAKGAGGEHSYAEQTARAGFEGIMRLSAFLLSLPRAISEKSHLYDSPGAKEYRAIVSSMQNRLDEGLSLGDFSRIHHLSKSYITKLFESYCGEGPMKYYGKLRILRVEELLLEGRGLQFIAERMNYSSVSYLSYSFKKIVGISVSNWLAKQRRNQRQQ